MSLKRILIYHHPSENPDVVENVKLLLNSEEETHFALFPGFGSSGNALEQLKQEARKCDIAIILIGSQLLNSTANDEINNQLKYLESKFTKNLLRERDLICAFLDDADRSQLESKSYLSRLIENRISVDVKNNDENRYRQSINNLYTEVKKRLGRKKLIAGGFSLGGILALLVLTVGLCADTAEIASFFSQVEEVVCSISPDSCKLPPTVTPSFIAPASPPVPTEELTLTAEIMATEESIDTPMVINTPPPAMGLCSVNPGLPECQTPTTNNN